MAKSTKNKTSYFRVLDLFFILYYFVTFVCYLLNLIGVSTLSKIYLNATFFTFPYILTLILTSFITFNQILFTKFPISFKLLLRVFLSIQFLVQIVTFILINKGSNLEFDYYDFLLCNAFVIIWSIIAFFQKILYSKPKKKH